MATDPTGIILNQRYWIGEKIAESSFSTIFHAIDVTRDIPVALKLLPQERCRPEHLLRMRMEAETLSRLDHPHIVRILSTGTPDDTRSGVAYYLATEYIDGRPLDVWAGEPDASLSDGINLIRQITGALTSIHEKKIIHGDLKPTNILVVGTHPPSAKLVDFGLARIKDNDEENADDPVRNTLQYMSPEQIGLLRQPVDERSDLYSLGIVFYRIATGQHPFRAESLAALLHQQTASRPAPPSCAAPAIPAVLDGILLKLLARNPAQRYQSARGLLSDLEQLQCGRTDFVPGDQDVPNTSCLSWLFHGPPAARPESPAACRKLQTVTTYIDRHFDEKITRKDLARLCAVSPDYLGKLFKSRMGKSIHDYINEQRIRHVTNALLTTDKKVIDIAFDAGFESLRTFNRIFLSIVGHTPTAYRKNKPIRPLR